MGRRADVEHVACGSPEPCSDVGSASMEGDTVMEYWPLSDSLTLGARSTAVASARMHARAVIGEWALADMAETVALVVSELVTNAVLASTDEDGRPVYADSSTGLPVVHLRLSSDRERLVIEVWDRSPQAPEARESEPDAENGRGLVLVEALSQRWGYERVPGWPGKVVWAELRVVARSPLIVDATTAQVKMGDTVKEQQEPCCKKDYEEKYCDPNVCRKSSHGKHYRNCNKDSAECPRIWRN